MVNLTARQLRFAERYAETLNGTRAAKDAGYAPRHAHREASRLLLNADVQAAIAEHRKRLADATFTDAVHVLRDLSAIAFADPAELSHLTRHSCRYCHGVGHAYQWADMDEFARACQAFRQELAEMPEAVREVAAESAPDSVGGFGFDPRRTPSHECPRCRGEGVEVLWRADTSRLEGSAQKLFAGMKETRDGINIILRDQDKALELLMRHFGMLNDRVQVKGDSENPIALLIQQVQGSAFQPVPNPMEGV